MKRNLLFNRIFVAAFAVLFGAASVPAAQVVTVFSDDFEWVVAGDRTNPTTNLTTAVDWMLENTGKIYQAKGALKFNASSTPYNGAIITKKLDLSASGGIFSVTVKACSWAKDNTALTIQLLDGETVIETITQPLVVVAATPYDDSKMEDYTLSFTKGTANAQLKFTGSKRFFISEVSVLQEVSGETPSIIAADLNFGNTEVNVEVAQQVSVLGANLDSDITVAVAGIGFSVTQTTLPKEGGLIDVKFLPTEKQAYEGTITLTSGTVSKTIEIAANAVQTHFSTIAELKASNADQTTEYTLAGDVVFVYRNERRIFVKDATGGLMIYDNFNPTITTQYEEGDVISGGIKGRNAEYKGLRQFVPSANTAVSSKNEGVVAPKVITIEELVRDYSILESQLVKLSNVTFEATSFPSSNTISISQGEQDAICRNEFKNITLNPLPLKADLIGFASIFEGTATEYQIAPRGNDDIIDITSTSITTPTQSSFKAFADNGQVTIVTSEAGVVEIYSIVGKRVLVKTIGSGSTTFPLERGAYIVKMGTLVVKVNN